MLTQLRIPLIALALVIVCVGVGYGYFIIDKSIQYVGQQTFAASPLPDLNAAPIESTKIYDREGGLIYEMGSSRRRTVQIHDVPDHVVNAFLAAEDRTFYSNPGISVKSLIRAIHIDVREESLLQGGSTITQQLAQQLVVNKEGTLWRKIREIIISLVLTRQYSKDEILERYLNEVPVGGELIGIGAAAQEYFNVSVSELTVAQGAYIASLINAPTILDPYANYDGLTDRQQLVLGRMYEFGFIPEESYQKALDQSVEFKPRSTVLKHPYFSFYVKHLLEDEFGKRTVNEGLSVQTSLDPDLQTQAEALVAAQAKKNATEWDAANASLVAANPVNGQIVAYVGGANFNESQVDMNTSKRQPGSTIKPLVYYTAFEQGYKPDTYVLDAVEDFGGGWKPTNYGGTASGRYVALSQALAGSLNIPAVRVMRGVGIDAATTNLAKMGFPIIKNYNYTLPLALGAVEVTPLDTTQAYAVIANQGRKAPLSPLLKVIDRSGKVLIDNTSPKTARRVLKQEPANAVTSIISDYQLKRRIYAGQYYADYTLPDRAVAAKTGTTSGPKDAWTIGYTPSLLTTVWTGNTSGNDLKSTADGINVAAPLWHDFMAFATQQSEVEEFPVYKATKPDTMHKYIDRMPRGYNPQASASATPTVNPSPTTQP